MISIAIRKRLLIVGAILLVCSATAPGEELLIERPARHWEFFDAVGPRAAALGRESGTFEAWVFPMKVLKDFRLRFRLNGKLIPGEAVSRSVQYRPGASTIFYSGDYYREHFLVRQNFVVPANVAGILVRLEIEASAKLEIEVLLGPDLQLMWPASLGGVWSDWDEGLQALVLGEGQNRFFAAVGSPNAHLIQRSYGSNYSGDGEVLLSLGEVDGSAQREIGIAASFESRAKLEELYRELLSDPATAQQRTEQYYQVYLDGLLQLDLPDEGLEQAYRWSMVSMFKGLVDNPFLRGRGLVAGFGLSKGEPRPGFAWFFGRDTFWTTLALTAAGDFRTARDAIRFIAQFQREDGKMPHEISQSASFVPWFEKYPYGYASADSTSLYIAAVADYVRTSGDQSFLVESWPLLTQALAYLDSTADENGFARNQGVGHGWVEGGPLLPVKTEFYQAGLHVQAVEDMADLAGIKGETAAAEGLRSRSRQMRATLEDVYWLAPLQRYAFAIDREGNAVDQPSVLSAVPMWFGLLKPERVASTVAQMSDEDHLADWGSRILSSKNPIYNPAGYHFGTVWPLFTGWASVGQYRYHAVHPAFLNLKANARLALDGSGGHTTEVVSGAAYSPLSTSSSHQIWSAAMVVSPLIRGLLGLSIDASTPEVVLHPHLPASWDWFGVREISIPGGAVDFRLERRKEAIQLRLNNRAGRPFQLDFAPALAPVSAVVSVSLNGRPVDWTRVDGATDWHPRVQVAIPLGESLLELRHRGEFAVTAPVNWPVFAQKSSGLRILKEDWNLQSRTLQLSVSGLAGKTYRLEVRGLQQIRELKNATRVSEAIEVSFPARQRGYQTALVEIRF